MNYVSMENARCTITIRFVYEYATLYLLHATRYVRMLCRIYDPKRVSRINYTVFPRYLDDNSCITTYLGKLITPQPSGLEGYCRHGPGGRAGGRAGGCQTCGTHISVTA